MSLNSNGELNLNVTYQTQEAYDAVISYLERELQSRLQVLQDTYSKTIEVTTYVQNDHFYDYNAEDIALGLLKLDGVTVDSFEAEILDEDGRHTRVIVDDNQVKTAVGQVVYTDFKVIDR